MPSYILRNIDPDLWERVKAKADTDGVAMRAIILALLAMYVDGRITVKAAIKASRS